MLLLGRYINIRKYFLDYIIKGSVYTRDLSVNYVIYIEDFELENKTEKNLFEKKYEEIISRSLFSDKIPAILSLYKKTKLKNIFNEDFFPTFNAKNFINKTFVHYPLEESNSFIQGALNNNKFYLNYLIKANIGIEGQITGFDEEQEIIIINRQNSFSYKLYYETLPSVQEKIENKSVTIPSNPEFNEIHTEVIPF